MAVKTFETMTLEALMDAGAALANMKMHPGWRVLTDLLDRLEQGTLETAIEDAPERLARHQGELAAVRTLKRLLAELPGMAEETLASKVEDGELDEDELARYVLRSGGGDLRL